MRIDTDMTAPRHGRRSWRAKRNASTASRSARARPSSIELALPDLSEDAVLTIVRPRGGELRSLRTLMSGTSWTPNTAYLSARNWGCTVSTEAATALIAAHVDEVVTSTVRSWSEPLRVELRTSQGLWSTIVDRVRQKDDGRFQLAELKANWAGFDTARARVQTRLGTLAANALGAEYVREVPASLGSPMLRANAAFVQAYRFVPTSHRARYVAADLLERLGTVSLGRLADALAPNAANGLALVCALMVQRLVSIDLETKVGRDSEVRSVPPLPDYMPGLYDALERRTSSLSDAA